MQRIYLSLPDTTPAASPLLSAEQFGAVYTSYFGLNRFTAAMDDLGLGHIRWPGGTLAESDPGRYGFDHEDFYDPALPRPGLSDMLALAIVRGASLSVILPTAVFAGDTAGARTRTAAFMDELLAGGFGSLPAELTLEIGNEYYAQAAFRSDAAGYGAVASAMAEEIARALTDPARNLLGAAVDIAVQMGRTAPEDAAIRRALSAEALAEIDLVAHHRFPWDFAGADDAIATVTSNMAAWAAESEGAGNTAPGLYLSAWNTASLTRNEALERYLDRYESHFGILREAAAIDLAARTDQGFETFWQKGVLIAPDGARLRVQGGLPSYDLGLAQASQLLEIFTLYAGLGLTRAAYFGLSSSSPAHATQTADGIQHVFVAGTMLGMMAESLAGTRPLDIHLDNARPGREGAPVNLHGFEGADHITLFVSANDIDEVAGLSVMLDLAALGPVTHVFAERLGATALDGWQEIFDAPNPLGLDMAAEERGYQVATRDALVPAQIGSALRLEFTDDFEIIRLVLAKSEAALPALEPWAGTSIALTPAALPGEPQPQDRALDRGTDGVFRLPDDTADAPDPVPQDPWPEVPG